MEDMEMMNNNPFDTTPTPTMPALDPSAMRRNAPISDQNGSWTPVANSGIQMPAGVQPGTPFMGPDGNMYCVADSAPALSPIAQNLSNAIPAPSQIIQMSPIVQPIALVPYATQNQPLLQYDPASRPPREVETTYKRKPYPLICALMAAFSILGILLVIMLNIFSSGQLGTTSISGIDAIMSTLASLGVGSHKGGFFTEVITPLGGSISAIFSESFGAGLAVVAVAACEVISLLAMLYIIVKYFAYLVKGKSPRNFSVASVVIIICALAVMFAGFSITKALDAEATLGLYFEGKSVFTVGIGIYVALAVGVITLLLPAFTNKKAYVVDNAVSSDIYIM